MPALGYVLWFLPNVAMAAVKYANEEFFDINVSLCYFGMSMIYAAAYGIIGSFWQYRKRK